MKENHGKNLNQILSKVRDRDQVHVIIVTNQDNGIAGYAIGSLIYRAGSNGDLSKGIPPVFARLSTVPEWPLQFFFSDRKLDFDPALAPGEFKVPLGQPFSINATDQLGLSVSLGTNPFTGTLTFHSWGNGTANLSLEPRENLLIALGPAIGNASPNALYIIAFTGITSPPR